MSNTHGRTPGWLVELKGRQVDATAITEVAEPTAWTVTKSEEGWSALTGACLDEYEDSGEVRVAVEAAVETFNGLARMSYADHQAVAADGVVTRIAPDGTKKGFVTIKPDPLVIRTSVKATTVGVDGDPAAEPPPDPRLVRYKRAHQDPRIVEALQVFGGAEDWRVLRNVFEIIWEANGGKKKVISRGWTTDDEIKMFEQNATDRRLAGRDAVHGRHVSSATPAEKISLIKGKQFVARLLECWINAS
jgi:hypothetical protein